MVLITKASEDSWPEKMWFRSATPGCPKTEYFAAKNGTIPIEQPSLVKYENSSCDVVIISKYDK